MQRVNNAEIFLNDSYQLIFDGHEQSQLFDFDHINHIMYSTIIRWLAITYMTTTS